MGAIIPATSRFRFLTPSTVFPQTIVFIFTVHQVDYRANIILKQLILNTQDSRPPTLVFE